MREFCDTLVMSEVPALLLLLKYPQIINSIKAAAFHLLAVLTARDVDGALMEISVVQEI